LNRDENALNGSSRAVEGFVVGLGVEVLYGLALRHQQSSSAWSGWRSSSSLSVPGFIARGTPDLAQIVVIP
jgi:hypothetical protein